MTFIDFFSGIGGFRQGFEEAGMECVGHVEIDPHARASYEAMFDAGDEWRALDITKVRGTDLPRADLWCGGFPCQDVSVAGSHKGLKGERSGLFYEIIRLLGEAEPKPRWVVLENVANLLSIDGGWGFAEVLGCLAEVGYDCGWRVLNSKDFGVAQNRERVFIVATATGAFRRAGGAPEQQVFFKPGAGGQDHRAQ